MFLSVPVPAPNKKTKHTCHAPWTITITTVVAVHNGSDTDTAAKLIQSIHQSCRAEIEIRSPCRAKRLDASKHPSNNQ